MRPTKVSAVTIGVAWPRSRKVASVGSCRSAHATGMTAKSKGFGRRQAYESLTCTTRGASGAGLWGFRISAGTHTGTIAGFGRSARTMRTTICPDQAVWWVPARIISVMYGGIDDALHERHRFPPRCLGRMHIGQAMPDHGANSGIRIGMFGGARGFRQRWKVSMMIMWSP